VWNSQRTSNVPLEPLGRFPDLSDQVLGDVVGGLRHRRPERRPGTEHGLHVHHRQQRALAPGQTRRVRGGPHRGDRAVHADQDHLRPVRAPLEPVRVRVLLVMLFRHTRQAIGTDPSG
jgi:hypothetical protein